MKFTQAIINKNGLVQKIPGTNKWEVKESFIWFLDYETKEDSIIIPVGFVTDFGSIPKFFLLFFNPTKYIAYILHDYMYSRGSLGIWSYEGIDYKMEYSRKTSDLALLNAMKVEGTGFFERYFVYFGVRIFGGLFFKK